MEDVLLSDVGGGFVLVDQSVKSGQLLRTFQGEHANLLMTGVAVTDPPGVRTVFQGLSNLSKRSGFEPLPEPSLDLAAWLVAQGEKIGDDGTWRLTFASRDAIFNAIVASRDSSVIDPRAFLLDLAERQIAAAGGPPVAAVQRTPLACASPRGGGVGFA